MGTIGLVPGTGLGMAAAGLARAGRTARVTEALYWPPAVPGEPRLAAAGEEPVGGVPAGWHPPERARAAGPARGAPAGAGNPALLVGNPALLSALAGMSALPASPYQVERVRQEYEALTAASDGAGAGGSR